MIFVDTGFFFAILQRRDQLHQRAKAWHNSLAGRLLTTEYVLWEVVNGLSGPAVRQKAHRAVDDVRFAPDWDVVEASPAFFDRGLELHRQHSDKEWSLTDCISFVVMHQRGVAQALTHDHHFEQAGFEACCGARRHDQAL